MVEHSPTFLPQANVLLVVDIHRINVCHSNRPSRSGIILATMRIYLAIPHSINSPGRTNSHHRSSRMRSRSLYYNPNHSNLLNIHHSLPSRHHTSRR
jgi:hypothetical protein